MRIKKFEEYKIITEAFGSKLSQYGYRVKDRLLYIVTDSNHISKKDVDKIKQIQELIDLAFTYYPEIDATIDRYEKKQSRIPYCAEHIYDWFIKGTELEKEI